MQIAHIITICNKFYQREQHLEILETGKSPAYSGTKTVIMAGAEKPSGVKIEKKVRFGKVFR